MSGPPTGGILELTAEPGWQYQTEDYGSAFYNSITSGAATLKAYYWFMAGSERFGVLFPLNVAQGETINSATLDFEITANSGDVFEYAATAVDNAVMPTSYLEADTFALVRTTARVSESGLPSVGSHTSPDLASIVQEIVDRPGWSYGNRIAILAYPQYNIDGDGFTIKGLNAVEADQPVLTVDWGDTAIAIDVEDLEIIIKIDEPTVEVVVPSNDAEIVVELDEPTFGVNYQIGVEDLEVVIEADEPTVALNQAITPSDVESIVELDEPAFGVSWQIEVEDLEVLTSIDPFTIRTTGELFISDVQSIIQLDEPAFTVSWQIEVEDLEIVIEVDEPNVAPDTNLAINDAEIVVELDELSFGVNFQIEIDDLEIFIEQESPVVFPANWEIGSRPRSRLLCHSGLFLESRETLNDA